MRVCKVFLDRIRFRISYTTLQERWREDSVASLQWQGSDLCSRTIRAGRLGQLACGNSLGRDTMQPRTRILVTNPYILAFATQIGVRVCKVFFDRIRFRVSYTTLQPRWRGTSVALLQW